MSMIDRCLRLYETLDYFVHYPARPLPQDYWNAKVDPDGNVRDLAGERDQRKSDLAYIAAFVNGLMPGKVLDIGFGLGELLEQLEVRHDCIGLDTSQRAIDVAQERCDADLRLGILEGDTFPANNFDVVIAHHVIEHVEEPIGFVRNICSILKPGGHFVCGTPNFASAAARVFGDRFRLLHDPTHVSLFTDDSLLRLLRDEGFVIEKVEFPFFNTRFASVEACEAMLEGKSSVSPAFWGSFVTVFARKVAE
ncbi:class I SAM-dependent methyltransferase [Roseibium sp.]|uniref:class I SAM-dependent methyltransferase n=1 Tax=Roseibium sp. TaxID=1936156 RepID=UPI0032662B12